MDWEWCSRPRLTRAGLRALVVATILIVTGARLGAVAAWAVIPGSLVEFWLVERKRPSFVGAVGMFFFVSVTLAAASFQTVYTVGLIETRSIEGGMSAVADRCADLINAHAPHEPFPLAVTFVYGIQVVALGWMLVTVGQLSKAGVTLFTSWAALVALVPAADWLILGRLTASALPDPGPPLLGVIVLSSFLLAFGGGAAALGLLVVRALADGAWDWLRAPQLTATTPPPSR